PVDRGFRQTAHEVADLVRSHAGHHKRSGTLVAFAMFPARSEARPHPYEEEPHFGPGTLDGAMRSLRAARSHHGPGRLPGPATASFPARRSACSSSSITTCG